MRIGKIDPATLPEIAIHPSALNYRLRSRLHSDGENVGFYAMQSHRVVPLAKECEVVGVKTREHPMPIEMWEVDGRLVSEGEMTIEGYAVSTETFFQVNRHLLQTMLRLVQSLAIGKTAIDLYAGVGFFSVPVARVCERVTAVE